jgi:hypothetical protein
VNISWDFDVLGKVMRKRRFTVNVNSLALKLPLFRMAGSHFH